MTEHVLVEDGIENVAAAIEQMKNKPVDMILCTGGMSVDPIMIILGVLYPALQSMKVQPAEALRDE